ncbi:MAG: hypothetical protein WBW58_13110, partial [Candidatus Acidiferrum sp.]
MSEKHNSILAGRESSVTAEAPRLRGAIAYAVLLVLLGSLSLVAGFETARTSLPDPVFVGNRSAQSPSHSVAPVRMPAARKNSDEEIKGLPPQQQAERLLERALQNDESSLDLLRENADGWRGQLKNTDELFDLVLAALDSGDLRVRTAAVDVDLAANNLSKSPASVTRLLAQLRRDPASRGMALWRLGSLGNRGVEPERVL